MLELADRYGLEPYALKKRGGSNPPRGTFKLKIKMANKNIFYSILGIITTFIFLFFVYKLINNSYQSVDFSKINQVKNTDNIKWSKENKNILIEYSDFQCPACRSFHQLLKTFESSSSPNFKLTKNITLVFRHFPLYQIHNNAFISAHAAEAAGKQNKFWQMANLLYENQNQWSKLNNPENYFIELAKNLDLNINQFKKDLKSNEIKTKVENNLKEAENMGLNATPTFIFNGKKIDFKSIDDFLN